MAFWYQTGQPTFAARAPHAEQRTLPSLDVVFPAAPLIDRELHGAGACVTQSNLGFYPRGQLFYKPRQMADAWVEIPFTVEEKAPRRLLLKVTRAEDYGIYQAYLNGVRIGAPMDLYAEEVSEWEHHLLDFWPEAGEYTLRLECTGRNRKSTGYYLGVESLRLRERRPRVTEWAWDKDEDWREQPTLYR